jgi:hypothetical protein
MNTYEFAGTELYFTTKITRHNNIQMEAKNTIFTTFSFSDYICWYSGINTYEQANTQAAKAGNSEDTDFMGQVINLLFNV